MGVNGEKSVTSCFTFKQPWINEAVLHPLNVAINPEAAKQKKSDCSFDLTIAERKISTSKLNSLHIAFHPLIYFLR